MSASAGDRILRDVFLGFMRIHILHHASEAPIFGLEMMDELKRHGYQLSPGTLYPMLHALEAAGLLQAQQELVGGKRRKYYRATRAGIVLLGRLRSQISELVEEVAKGRTPARPPTRSTRAR